MYKLRLLEIRHTKGICYIGLGCVKKYNARLNKRVLIYNNYHYIDDIYCKQYHELVKKKIAKDKGARFNLDDIGSVLDNIFLIKEIYLIEKFDLF